MGSDALTFFQLNDSFERPANALSCARVLGSKELRDPDARYRYLFGGRWTGVILCVRPLLRQGFDDRLSSGTGSLKQPRACKPKALSRFNAVLSDNAYDFIIQ